MKQKALEGTQKQKNIIIQFKVIQEIFKAGQKIYNRAKNYRDYAKSAKWLIKAAQQGHLEAQYILGTMYYYGKGVAKNLITAIYWLKQAAIQGYIDAKFKLSTIYHKDMALVQNLINEQEAITWLQQAADKYHPQAIKLFNIYLKEIAKTQYQIGLNHYRGNNNFPKDYQKAIEMFTLAAKHGLPEAQCKLGIIFLEGKLLPKDEEEAEKWLNLAAEQGYHKAKQYLLTVRKILANIYYCYALDYCLGTNNGITKDCKLAIEWCTKAANLGHDQAQYILGSTYYYGNCGEEKNVIEPDHHESLKWWTKSAAQGNIKAQYDLGTLYRYGEENIVPQDLAKTFELWQASAKQGQKEAQVGLGILYYNGEGTTKDLLKAAKYWIEADKQGYPQAKELLKLYAEQIKEDQSTTLTTYLKKIYIEQNDEETKMLLNKTKVPEDLQDQKNLMEVKDLATTYFQEGQKYYFGQNDKIKDYNLAITWLTKAAILGLVEAQLLLGSIYYHGANGEQENCIIEKNHNEALKWLSMAAEQKDPEAQYKLSLLYRTLKKILTLEDQTKIIDLLQESATQGLKEAQFDIGEMYHQGEGVTKDLVTAATWWEKAANQEHLQAKEYLNIYAEQIAEAQYQAGLNYYDGSNGFVINLPKAIELLGKAAKNNHSFAAHQLSMVYLEGKGVVSDNGEIALNLLEEAAISGSANAQYQIGIMCLSIINTNLEDYTETAVHYYETAETWLNKAANQGHHKATQRLIEVKNELSKIYYNCGQLYYTEQRHIIKDYSLTIEWWTKAANLEHINAQNNLGSIYANNQDYATALYWRTKAAEQNHPKAQYQLGSMYFYGDGITIDFAKAIYWWTKAAEQNHPKAQYELGVLYRHGHSGSNIPEDKAKTIELWQKSADQEIKEAQFGLGVMNYFGEGIPINFTQAGIWFTKAAQQNHLEAKYNLGLMYYYGIGEWLQDKEKGIQLWQESAQKGVEEAKNALNFITSPLDNNKMLSCLYQFESSSVTAQNNAQPTPTEQINMINAITILNSLKLF